MKRKIMLLAALLLIGCSEEKSAKSEVGVDAQKATQVSTKEGADRSDAIPEDIVNACSAYGKMAAAIASDRDAGMSFTQKIQQIKRDAPTVDMAREVMSLADVLYNKPWANQQNPKSAGVMFFLDCEMRMQKARAGGRTVSTKVDVAHELGGFHTYRAGTTLPALLAQYGLRIQYIEITPVKAMRKRDDDMDGDVLYSMMMTGFPKAMPCGLHKWLLQGQSSKNAENVAEVIYRNGGFLTNAKELDPVLYWAATGKCSEEYGLPM